MPVPGFSMLTLYGILSGGLLPELLGETDENSFGTPDVAEPVDVFVIDNFIDQRRSELGEPGEGVVDVLNCEHYALVSQRVHGSCAVIGLDGGGVEARELDAAVAVRGTHHSNLDMLAAHSGDATGPFTIDGHAAFEGKAEFSEKLNCCIDVFHHDADVVHTLDFHDVSLVTNRRWGGLNFWGRHGCTAGSE